MRPGKSQAPAILITFMAFAALLFADDPEPAALSFIGLASEYSSFDQIDAVVTNVGEAPVFLPSWHPRLQADLHRWNDETGVWERGSSLRICWSVADREKPIRLVPGESKTLGVSPRAFTMTENGIDVAFETHDEGLQRPASGTYRLLAWYALEPWAWGYSLGPKSKRLAISASFEVVAARR